MKRILLSLALALGIFSIPIPSFATVSSTTNTVQYSGDGYSTSFSFNNNVYLASDLNVYEVTAGVSTLLTLNTNYLVSLTAISGVTGAYTATINLAGGSSPAGALAVGTTLVITRNIPYTQLINISDYSATPATTWNQAHDREVILSQQLLNLVNRSILQSITASTPITFPSAVASNIIGWNAAGTGLTNYVPNSSTYISLPLAASQGGTGSTANANAANGVATYASNGNFGIGTASPSTALHVKSNASGGQLTLEIGSTGSPGMVFNNTTTGILGQIVADNAGNLEFYSHVGANIRTLTLDPTGDVFTDAWSDYSASSTIVGWGSISNKKIYTKNVGKTVFVYFYIDGISNATNTTFTLPYTSGIPISSTFGCRAEDGGGTPIPGLVILGTSSSTVSVYKDFSASNWTASNEKYIEGQFWYQAQ